jgi:signal recognition particle subunit SEC65
MPKKQIFNIYLSKNSPKESRKKPRIKKLDPYIVDISKIIRDLGYEIDNLATESEFILNYTIRKKIVQGIYSTKCDSMLICYKNITPEFESNLENFLSELPKEEEYAIHRL